MKNFELIKQLSLHPGACTVRIQAACAGRGNSVPVHAARVDGAGDSLAVVLDAEQELGVLGPDRSDVVHELQAANARLRQRKRELKREVETLIALLEATVQESCVTGPVLASRGVAAYADAMYTLHKLGRFTITHEHGRHVVGKLVGKRVSQDAGVSSPPPEPPADITLAIG